MGGGWLIGVVLCTIGSFAQGLAKLAIRKSFLMTKDQRKDKEDGSSSLSTVEKKIERAAQRMRRTALLCMTFFVPVFDVAALYFASPSVLAGFAGCTLSWVILLSGPLVGEHPGKPRMVAAILIVIGEVTVTMFGDHTSGDYDTLEALVASYKDPVFIGFYVATALFMCIMAYWMKYTNVPFLKRFAWGFSGGYMTGCGLVKDALCVVKASGEFRPWKLPWYFFVLLIIAAANALGGLAILVGCMKRYDATYSSGMFAGGLVVSTTVMSAIHYDTFGHLDPGLSYILYPAGLIVLVVGVGLLAHLTKDGEASHDECPQKESDLSTETDHTAASDISDMELTLPTRKPIVYGEEHLHARSRKEEHDHVL